MIRNNLEIISYLPREIKNAYDFLVKKNAFEKEINTALTAVAHLMKLEPDTETLLATILFQVPNITPEDLEEMQTQFGEETTAIVKYLMQFSRIDHAIHTTEKRKVFLTRAIMILAKDTRVLYIKVATRLAKLQVQKFDPGLSLADLAREALELHAPLADILGLREINIAIEDIAFKYLKPDDYQKTLVYRSHKKSINEKYIKKIVKTIDEVSQTLELSHTTEVVLKHLYEIYRKRSRKFNSNSLKDILSFLIIVPSKRDAYRMLGVIHSIWKPQHQSFKDYISIPKINNYQALHTTVYGPDERICLFQITTPDMIKERRISISKSSTLNQRAYNWIKKTMKESFAEDAEKLIKTMQDNSMDKSIFIFTDKGQIINLPKKSTCIDVAYNINAYTGNHAIEAYVNEIKSPISQVLQSGDTVKVITSKASAGPKLAWLDLTLTSEAKKGIQNYFKKLSHEEQKELGEKALADIYKTIFNKEFRVHRRILDKKLKKHEKLKNIDTVVNEIGSGELTPTQLIKMVYTEKELLDSYGKNKSVQLKIQCSDKQGLLNEISNQIMQLKLNVLTINMHTDSKLKVGWINLKLEINNIDTLFKTISSIKNIPEVKEVFKV